MIASPPPAPQRILRGRAWTPCLASAALLAFCGCASVQSEVEWKLSLDQLPIAALAPALAKGSSLGPGEQAPLVVSVTGKDGRTYLTEGAGRGRIPWSELRIAAKVVAVSPEGIVSLPRDPRVSAGQSPHLTVTVPGQPGIQAELDIPIRYDHAFTANCAGRNGAPGRNGEDGLGGATGKTGSNDPQDPTNGEKGGDGTPGTDGEDGGPGGDAAEVQVRVALSAAERPMLQASVVASGHETLYLVDPKGGSLTIKADGGLGGAGGNGGRGGPGGHGGFGGVGRSSGPHGKDAPDGKNGRDGSQGKGGAITVIFDPGAKPFLDRLHFSNAGGDGPGPAPVLKEAPVAPLW